jgi:hypothetical protein
MPLFRETKHIFTKDHGEVFEPEWMMANTIIYPETKEWDYSNELYMEDVEIWEVIKEWSNASKIEDNDPGPCGIYAAWRPHAELFMVKLPKSQGGVVSFFGLNAEKQVRKFLTDKGIDYFPYPANYETGIFIDKLGTHYKDFKTR